MNVPKYKETVRCFSEDAALMKVNAGSLAGLGTQEFKHLSNS